MSALHTTFAAALSLALCTAAVARPFPEAPWPRLRNSRQDWMDRPDASLIVRWVRVNEFPQFEVRDGVCVLYMPDNPLGLLAAAQLVRGCLASGTTRTDIAPADALRVHWHRSPDRQAMQARVNGSFDLRLRPQAAGFYWRDDDGAVHILTTEAGLSFGHELKHGFDGEYHDKRGNWLPLPAGGTR